MELKPGIGIDNIVFGMSQFEIESILGRSDEQRDYQNDDFKYLCVFNKQKIHLSFYMLHKNKFGFLDTTNDKLTYNNLPIINSNIDFALNEIFIDLVTEWELKEFDTFTEYFSKEYWLNLHVEYGVITNVEMGVPFKNEDEFEWPELAKENAILKYWP